MSADSDHQTDGGESRRKRIMDRANAIRRIGLFVAVGTWVFLLVSLASFHADDWPAHHVYPLWPRPEPLRARWARCSPTTATSSLARASSCCCSSAASSWRCGSCSNKLTDVWLRAVGLLLLSVAFAAIVNKISPGSGTASPKAMVASSASRPPSSSRSHFNHVGSYIVLALSFMVGLVLAADELVEKTPAVAAGAIAKAREIAPDIPRPTFEFRMPDFLRRSPAAAEVAEVEPEAAAATATATTETPAEASEEARSSCPRSISG